MSTTPPFNLRERYQSYLAEVNKVQTSSTNLYPYLSPKTIHNERPLTQAEYTAQVIPNSVFTLLDLIVDEKQMKVAARLRIELEDGRGLGEHCFYEFGADGKIVKVWSVLDWD